MRKRIPAETCLLSLPGDVDAELARHRFQWLAFYVKPMSKGKCVEFEADEGDMTLIAGHKFEVNGADFKYDGRPI